MAAASGVIQLFCKSPVAGRSKTRLIPALGEEGAAKLHRYLAENTLKMLESDVPYTTQLWCYPDTSHPFFLHAPSLYGVSLHRQSGSDLGERMQGAVMCALEKHEWVILIGTDCPGLNAEVMAEATGKLEGGAELVFGPAADGGFYLVGMRQYPPGLFQGMQWGHDAVMKQIASRLQEARLTWSKLGELTDIDRPADLVAYADLIKKAGLE